MVKWLTSKHNKTWQNVDCVHIYFGVLYLTITPFQWRHNDNDGVSNHQPHGCLLNRLFRRRSKKTSKLRVTGLCVGNSPGPVNSPHKGPVTRKMFPFDDVIMRSSFIHLYKTEMCSHTDEVPVCRLEVLVKSVMDQAHHLRCYKYLQELGSKSSDYDELDLSSSVTATLARFTIGI